MQTHGPHLQTHGFRIDLQMVFEGVASKSLEKIRRRTHQWRILTDARPSCEPHRVETFSKRELEFSPHEVMLSASAATENFSRANMIGDPLLIRSTQASSVGPQRKAPSGPHTDTPRQRSPAVQVGGASGRTLAS